MEILSSLFDLFARFLQFSNPILLILYGILFTGAVFSFVWRLIRL